MEVISDNVVVIGGGEEIPAGYEDFIKIALVGSSDLSPNPSGDWQTKFAQGIAAVTSSDPGRGIIMYRGMKFLIMNCKSWGPSAPIMSYENQEFVQKLTTDLNYANSADCIFFNVHKKSQAIFPLLEFATFSSSGKMVVRCSSEYANYGYIRVMCENLQIPLLPGATTSVLTVVQTMSNFIPKFQEINKYTLPE